jgi:hypothetical protein
MTGLGGTIGRLQVAGSIASRPNLEAAIQVECATIAAAGRPCFVPRLGATSAPFGQISVCSEISRRPAMVD